MRTASVSLQNVVSSHRLDPEFHLIAQAHQTAVEALRKRFDEKEAREKLAVLSVAYLEPLIPLCTGATRRGLDESMVRRQARLHPFLALALVEEFLPTLEARLDAQRQALNAQSAEIETIRSSLAGPGARRKVTP